MEEALSLKELNRLLKKCLKAAFPEQYWVKAEIGSMTLNRSGHCYLELVEKGTNSDIIEARNRAIIWANVFHMLRPYFETSTGHTFQEGLRVMLRVSVEYHELYGLSLTVHDIEPAFTIGEMELRRREIIKRLEAEGVLHMNQELPFPLVPQRIAVVSSEKAAGYQDFMHQITHNEREFLFFTELFSAGMQGKESPYSIIQALDRIHEQVDSFDAVALIRGGGAQADLSWFDHYELAFHISQFPIPVLTGIGHEKDVSIADLVAHRSLKTPTAIAAFLVESLTRFDDHLHGRGRYLSERVHESIQCSDDYLEQRFSRLRPLMRKAMDRHRQHLLSIGFKLHKYSRKSLKIKEEESRKFLNSLQHYARRKVEREKENQHRCRDILTSNTRKAIREQFRLLDQYGKTSRHVDPVNLLKKGYSITTDSEGTIIRSSDKVQTGDNIVTRFHQGKTVSKITKKRLD